MQSTWSIGVETSVDKQTSYEVCQQCNLRARKSKKDLTEVGIVLSHFGDRRGDSFAYIFDLGDNIQSNTARL